jgi:Flp pilus assembly pilin Flp
MQRQGAHARPVNSGFRCPVRNAFTALRRFWNEEDGNTLVAVVATIGLVGAWVSGKWTALNIAL